MPAPSPSRRRRRRRPLDRACSTRRRAASSTSRRTPARTRRRTRPCPPSSARTQARRTGSVVMASNDIKVRAGSITDADATTRSASGGGINMHVYSANADTTPRIDVTVGAGAQVSAPTVTVDAQHDTTPPTYSDGFFNAATQVERRRRVRRQQDHVLRRPRPRQRPDRHLRRERRTPSAASPTAGSTP